MNNKETLKNFIESQLVDMAKVLEENYSVNMANRKNNPFNCLPSDMNKYMGLGRSLDSQLGNRLQNIAFYCARLKFGDICVPNIIYMDIINSKVKVASIQKGFAPGKELKSHIKPYNQYIITKDSFSYKDLRNRFGYKAVTKENPIYAEYSVSFDSDYEIISKDKTPVDLLIIYEKNKMIYAYAFEIKAGGNLDTKNSVANQNEVENLNKWFSFANGNNKDGIYKGYFATCYSNSDTPHGNIFAKLPKEQIMNGKEFWTFILPNDITYDTFIDIYKSAFKLSNIEKTLKNLKA